MVCAASVVFMLAGMAQAQSYGPPLRSVGDTWTIKEEGGAPREIKVVAVDSDGYLIEGAYSGCPTCRVSTDKNLTWLKMLDADGKPVDVTKLEWVPVGPGWKFLDFPLEIKKAWRISEQAFLQGSVVTYTVDVTVDGYEDVRTPAGTFKAYKIRSLWTLETRWGRRPTWTNVTWFAPDAKGSVKFTSTRPGAKDWELMSYSLK